MKRFAMFMLGALFGIILEAFINADIPKPCYASQEYNQTVQMMSGYREEVSQAMGDINYSIQVLADKKYK